jgi:two-component system sensor histidine kinase BaeS
MARAFNQMGAQLQASEERRRAFLADVTHELRTPLTVIGGQLEAIEDGVYEANPERMAALLAQVRQMSGLIEDLHTISLAEVGALQLDPVPIDLNTAADEAIAGFAPTAELQGVILHTELADGPVIVSLDTAATRRVLANLVSNALRHTPPGESVTLAVRGEASAGYIEVTDTGSGMDAELTARAFERFEKGTDSDGSGLGLAIARDLMAAQGGTIELDSSLGAGTRVRLGFALPEG